MGNYESQQDDFDTEWRFVGRDADLKEMKELLSEKRSVLVFGMKKIGKSRFLAKLCKQSCKSKKCIWKDFELDDIESEHTLYDWFIEFLTSIDARDEKERFENKYPSKSVACNSCEQCKLYNRDKCLKRNDLIKTAINTLIVYLGKYEKETVLFLDNIDKIMDSPLKDSFLYFHRQSLTCSRLRTILASANKPKQTSKVYGSLELKPLDSRAIFELLFETTEQREYSQGDGKDCDRPVECSPDFRVFKPENKPYITAIVGLCEGLPLAAVMSGLLLTEDDGLLTPANLVEILICMRLSSLSPDNCPPDDRLDIYKDPMNQVKDVSEFFHCLNQQLTGTVINMDQAVAAAADSGNGVETEAMVKLKILKKALDKSILSIQSLSGEQQLKWHGIFRECQAALQAIDNLPSDAATAKTMVLKFMKENVVKAGLDFPDEVLNDPKSLELAIKSLCCTEEELTSPPVQANEDCEKGRMSLLKEHYSAKTKVDNTEFHSELSSDMKDCKEVKPYRDVENDLPNDSEKVNIRYSASGSSDSSDDSDGVNLEFTNTNISKMKELKMNDVTNIPQNRTEQNTDGIYFSNPPPYTSLPRPSEVRATPYRNQGGENRPIKGQSISNSVGEPPPKYALNDPVRRTRSDPTYNRLGNNVSRHLDDTARSQINLSVSSLTGPSAMILFPPSIPVPEIVVLHESDRHHAVPGDDISRQATSLRLTELKDNIPSMPVDNTSIESGFTTQGQAGMSYKYSLLNDLHSDQEKYNQISHVTLAQPESTSNKNGRNGALSQVEGNLSDSTLLINNSTHETNVKRSPTAIVRPMPKRRSPPNVDKQSERRNSNASPSNIV